MRVTVTVRPREGILDPQGEALRRSLAGLGYDVADVRAGKVFDLDIEAADEADARRIADEISERVLSNPLIEDYRVGARDPGRRARLSGLVRRPRRRCARSRCWAPSPCGSGTATTTWAAPRR